MSNEIDFLWKAALSLPSENRTHLLLQSYYLTKSREVAKGTIKLPEHRYGASIMCRKCSTLWSNGGFKLSIQSARTRNKKYNKFVNKFQTAKRKLNPKLKYLAKHIASKVCNVAVLTCKLCNYRTKCLLKKPLYGKSKQKLQQKSEGIKIKQEKIKISKSKKRKRDKFKGLHKDIILSVQSKMVKPIINKPKSNKPQEIKSKQVVKNENIKRPLQKSNKPIAKQNSTKLPNSILKFANLLKMNAQNATQGTNKLNKLLKQ